MTSFKSWLVQFKNVDNPFGDLARNMLQDRELPRITPQRMNEVYYYLQRKNDLAADIFKEAFEVWQGKYDPHKLYFEKKNSKLGLYYLQSTLEDFK